MSGPGWLPLDYIEVNGLRIPADMIEAESIFHDIDNGTLSLTLVNVREVVTQYRHMTLGKPGSEPRRATQESYCGHPGCQGHQSGDVACAAGLTQEQMDRMPRIDVSGIDTLYVGRLASERGDVVFCTCDEADYINNGLHHLPDCPIETLRIQMSQSGTS